LTVLDTVVKVLAVAKEVKKKPIIGLVGGICAGKSAVANEFGRLGCVVIDADAMAKQLLDKPEIRSKIIAIFGKSIVDENGKIDRQKLAAIVFTDEKYITALNDIIHPIVLEQTQELINSYMENETIKAIILDVPLLAEVGWENRCEKLVFVDSTPENRLERAKKRGMSKNELKIRENFQISLDKKLCMSDYIVNNNSDLSELGEQVGRIFHSITSSA